MMNFVLVAVFVLVLLANSVHAGTSLMGVGGGGGGGMPKGISFNVDTNDKRMTRIHGNAVKIDLDMLEIMTNGGKLKYSPTHMEFETGTTRWMTTMTPVSNHNIFPYFYWCHILIWCIWYYRLRLHFIKTIRPLSSSFCRKTTHHITI